MVPFCKKLLEVVVRFANVHTAGESKDAPTFPNLEHAWMHPPPPPFAYTTLTEPKTNKPKAKEKQRRPKKSETNEATSRDEMQKFRPIPRQNEKANEYKTVHDAM